MPVLKNARHERFAQEIAKGKSAAAAYGIAGFKEHRHNAAALARKQHISARVAEILAAREKNEERATERAVERTGITKAWIMDHLRENAERAMQAVAKTDDDGKPIEYRYEGSVANRALELLGKEIGMFIDRREQGKPGDFSGLPDDEIDRQLIDRFRQKGLSDRQIRALLDERVQTEGATQ